MRVKSLGLGCLVGVSIAVILTLTVAYLRGELPLQSKLTSQSTVDFGRRVIVPVLAVIGGLSGLVIEHRRTRKTFEDRSNAIHL